MPMASNCISLSTSGIVGLDGTNFIANAMTDHAVLIGGTTSSAITNLGPTATTGQVLQSAGASADPAFSTATYPLTTSVNQLLYSSAANTITGLATALDGVLITSHTGVPSLLANGVTGDVLTATTGAPPSWQPAAAGGVSSVSGTAARITSTGGANPVIDIDGTYVGQTSITTLGTIATGTWSGTTIAVDKGGTGAVTLTGVLTGSGTGAITANAVTQYGVLIGGASNAVGSTAVGNAGQILQSSGAGVNPAYSTATYPSVATGTGTILRADGTNWVATTSTYPTTNAISTLLYASASNVMSALATANNGMLVTSATGVPSVLAGPGATGKVLQSNAAAAPSFSTATYPSAATGTGTILRADGTNWVATTATYPTSTTANQILFSSATSVIGEITTANNGILITSAGGVPSISSTLPSTVQGNITTVGTITSGTWDGTDVAVSAGGTGNNTFTAYSVICAGTTATGAFQNVSGVGSSTQVLTSNGAGALPTWQTPASGAGNWIKISSSTASSSATIDFTGLTNTYGMYVVTISFLAPATDATTLWMRTSTNGGSSYDAGASDYAWLVDSIEMDTAPTSSITADDLDSQIELTGTDTMGNTTNENGAFTIWIANPSAVQNCRIYGQGEFRGAVPQDNYVTFAGARLAVADVDAIRFLMSSGNITTGIFTLYGLSA